jgi:hypothetical protein
VSDFKINEWLAFPKQMDHDDTLPFGIGRICEVKANGTLVFQWWGNKHCHPRGTFHPGWMHPTTREYYYAKQKKDESHVPMLAQHFKVEVKPVDVICHGFDLLTEAGHLSDRTRDLIAADKWVREASHGKIDELFRLRKL